MAPKLLAIAAPMTARMGMPGRPASSAAGVSTTEQPHHALDQIRSASRAASASRQRASSSPHIHRSMFWHGAPLAMAWICGSRNPGPHLNT